MYLGGETGEWWFEEKRKWGVTRKVGIVREEKDKRSFIYKTENGRGEEKKGGG